MTILAITFILAAALAVWGARRTASARDFFAAGHRAGPWLAGLAGTAAAVSGFVFVGGPGLFAVAGAGSLWIILSAPLTGALQCWVVGERVVTELPDRPLTLPALLGERLGGEAVGIVSSLAILGGCVASLAVQARAAAVLGETFFAVDGWIAAAAVMAATAAYTAAGGMRAGLVADAVQGSIMAVVAVILAAAALTVAGGPFAALHTLASQRPDLAGSFGSFAPAKAASLFLLFALGTLAQPHYIQKFFFVRRRADLRRMPAVLTGALGAMLAVWLGVGLAGAALVAQGRLTLASPDELAPRVMGLLGPWAIFLAGLAVLAAMMSTSASFLNLAAAAVTRDLAAAVRRAEPSLTAARWVTAGVALTATAAGVFSDRAVAWLGVAGWGFFTAAFLPVMTVGLAWRGTTAPAAASAIAVGALTDIVLELARPHLPPALEPGLAGAAVGVLVLVCVSLWPSRLSTSSSRRASR